MSTWGGRTQSAGQERTGQIRTSSRFLPPETALRYKSPHPIAVTQPPQPAAASVLKPNFGIVFVFLFTVRFFCFPLFVTEGTVTK